jgi:hypothetical protein
MPVGGGVRHSHPCYGVGGVRWRCGDTRTRVLAASGGGRGKAGGPGAPMVGAIHTPESAIHRLATQWLLVGNLASAAVLGGAILAPAPRAADRDGEVLVD